MKRFFKKLTFTAGLVGILCSTSVFAVDLNLPAGCEFGRDTAYDVDLNNVANLVEDGFQPDFGDNPIYEPGSDPVYDPSAEQQAEIDAWKAFYESLKQLVSSFDYLRVEAPEHVLKGDNFVAKGNLFDIYANVNFHNSEKGFVGKDKSNIEANSYLTMSFEETYGYGLVWVSRGGLCSGKGVWVQEAPKVNLTQSVSGGSKITVGVGYQYDQYSKAAKDPTTTATLRVYADLDGGGASVMKSYNLSSSTGNFNVTLKPAHNGVYHVYAIIDDGKYSKNMDLGVTRVTGGGATPPPCPGCGFN